MRAYLESFFKEFSYLPEDGAVLLDAYDRIAADGESHAAWQQGLALYDSSYDCDYPEILRLANVAAERLYLHEYTVELLIFLCLSKKAREYYRAQNIEDRIYHDTMLDLRYKLEECKLVKGVVGSFVAGWFIGFFNLTRFSFGRLQIGLKPFGREYARDGKVLTPESPVLDVHIPRTGTPLLPEACMESYRRAKAFYRAQVGEEAAFYCHSWLLYPENFQILSPQSNTYRFMAQYDIIQSGINRNGEDLWRLFDTQEQHWARLPADTSMRRAYVEHIRRGGKTGWGLGVFFL